MSTTISSYSVSLGLDAKEYVKGSGLARSETATLKRAINEARTPLEKYAQRYELLEKALAKNAISLGTYKRLLDEAKVKAGLLAAENGKLAASHNQAASAANKHNRSLAAAQNTTVMHTTGLGHLAAGYQSVTAKLSPLVSLMGAYIGFSTAKAAVGLAVAAENASVQFEVLTGSVEDSLVLMRELRLFAEKSPITFMGAQDAAKTLLSFNVATQDVIPTVKMLGDVVGGNNERFKMISLAFAQMSAAGRLMGQDLLQMINAGFNPLQEISRKTGESLIDLKKRMEDGGVSSQEVADAFRTATEEGGKFFGMTERLSETVGGKLNIAMSDLQKSGERLGTTLGPLAADMAKAFASATENAGPLLAIIRKMTDGLRFIIAFAADAGTLASDIASKMAGGEGSGRKDAMSNINAFLYELDQRPILEAQRKEQEKNAKMSERVASNKTNAANQEGKAIKTAKEQAKEKLKAEKEALAIAKKKQREEERFAKEQKRQRLQAFESAQKYFEEERRMQRERQQQLRNTKISSLEVGSEGAAAFLQDSRNQAIFGRQEAMAAMAEPTDRQLVQQTLKQLNEMQSQTKKQERMVAILGNILDEAKSNRFQRIR